MTQGRLYDLLLLLATGAPEEQRGKIIADVESAIAKAGGSIERRGDWGTRPLTFRIDHQSEALYHLLQFRGPTALLESLNHTLRITDGVLRFRIIRVTPGTPPPPSSPPPIVAVVSAGAPNSGAPADE